MKLSVVVCTHNCPTERLNGVIQTLLEQDTTDFDVVVVDNDSRPPVVNSNILASSSRIRLVVERELGLTAARMRGVHEATSELIVFVDDDNFLSPEYLRLGIEHFAKNPKLGVLGGRSRPEFLEDVPAWLAKMNYAPGCNDSGEEIRTVHWRETPPAQRHYPSFAPIGTGMMLRRAIFECYADVIKNDPARRLLDRRGKSLASGGDNDIVMIALRLGHDVTYDPAMNIRHQIPAERIRLDYVRRYSFESNATWVQVLNFHDISPWKPIRRWTVPLRLARAWLRTKPWRSSSHMIAWSSACGLIEGQARAGSHRTELFQARGSIS